MEASLLGLANHNNIYLLLAEFSVRSVNYGSSFFPSIYGPRASRLGHKSMHSTDLSKETWHEIEKAWAEQEEPLE